MHITRKEHNPPNVYAYCGDYDASFYVLDGEIMNGKFPSSGAKLVKKFILRYKNDLLEMWENKTYKKLPFID